VADVRAVVAEEHHQQRLPVEVGQLHRPAVCGSVSVLKSAKNHLALIAKIF
jgi:hypothetical protein